MSGATLIADENPESRGRLVELLGEHTDLELLEPCATCRLAADSIRLHRPDTAFLAADLPDQDLRGLLQLLLDDAPPSVPPSLVVVTGYDRELLRDLHACRIDYLLRPVEAEPFRAVMEHVRRDLERRDDVRFRVARLLELAGRLPTASGWGRLLVRDTGAISLLEIDEIDWVESAGNYVRIHAGGEVHQTRATLSGIEGRLDRQRFVRIHRTLIVNVDRIRKITPHFHGDAAVVLRDGTRLNLSRGYRHRLQRYLEIHTA